MSKIDQDTQKAISSTKRKNSWHKRRVNSLYNKMKFLMNNSADALTSKLQMSIYGERINKSFNEITELTNSFKMIVENSPSAEELIDQLSVHDLHDLNDIEKTGAVSRITFKKVVSAGDLRKKALEKISIRENEIVNLKLSSIDLVQYQIDKLLDIIDNKVDSDEEN